MKTKLTAMVIVAAFVVPASGMAQRGPHGIRGDSSSVIAAERLLASVGGRQAWTNRTFIVEERGYLRSGDVAELTISRDFSARTRLLRRTTPSVTLIEWLSPSGGWTSRNGSVTPLSPEDLAIELQGLNQEPYAIYHRLAHNDSTLRVELRDNALYVYESGERLLCWFNLDARSGLVGWGNFYDGSINQHWYGPLTSFGVANLPKFGAQSTGGFRFEYLAARMADTPLREPARRPDDR
jgi:hypothetical protein